MQARHNLWLVELVAGEEPQNAIGDVARGNRRCFAVVESNHEPGRPFGGVDCQQQLFAWGFADQVERLSAVKEGCQVKSRVVVYEASVATVNSSTFVDRRYRSTSS
jgi:hypothetical protein